MNNNFTADSDFNEEVSLITFHTENGKTVEFGLRKKGKWIAQNPHVDTEECSECGYNILSAELETPYCPWCGSYNEEGTQWCLSPVRMMNVYITAEEVNALPRQSN